MKLSQARFAVFILAILVSTSGCGVINRIRAKNELNEAARAYKAGRFGEAEAHSRRALELDPDQKNAARFIARSIHAQFRPGVDTPENKKKAVEAIEAYKIILEKSPDDEEAYKAIAALYGVVDEDKQREWIMQRASRESSPADKRAEAYVILASKDWNCSYSITELPANKKTENKDGKVVVAYQKPQSTKDFDTAQQCVTRGLAEAEKAVSLDPNSDAAMSFKTNLLREAAKLAEMEGNTDKKADLSKQADAAQNRAVELNEMNRKKKEAEEAQKPATTPAS